MKNGTRIATQNDVTTIVEFLRNYHENGSNLADIPFDKQSMRHAVEYYITFPKHVCFIYEKNEQLRGVIMGSIEPFMFNEKRKWATDLLNVAQEGGPWLLRRFFEWAKSHRVDRIFMGVSTGNDRSNQLYEAMGMERLGGMYGLTFNTEA